MKRIKKSLIHVGCGGDVIVNGNYSHVLHTPSKTTYIQMGRVCCICNVNIRELSDIELLTDEEWDAKYKGDPYHKDCGGIFKTDTSSLCLSDPPTFRVSCTKCDMTSLRSYLLDNSCNIEYLTENEWQQKYGDNK